MSYTYDGVRAEVEYRRTTMLAGAEQSRLVRRLRRAGTALTKVSATRQQVRDGTDPNGYDLAA
jgi:hypothetical protein